MVSAYLKSRNTRCLAHRPRGGSRGQDSAGLTFVVIIPLQKIRGASVARRPPRPRQAASALTDATLSLACVFCPVRHRLSQRRASFIAPVDIPVVPVRHGGDVGNRTRVLQAYSEAHLR